MNNFSADEQSELVKLNFHWSESDKGFFSDAWENEMGIYRDCHDTHFILRTRRWDDEDCEYRDDYENFSSFGELLAYLA